MYFHDIFVHVATTSLLVIPLIFTTVHGVSRLIAGGGIEAAMVAVFILNCVMNT
jgi:hypothetical protein